MNAHIGTAVIFSMYVLAPPTFLYLVNKYKLKRLGAPKKLGAWVLTRRGLFDRRRVVRTEAENREVWDLCTCSNCIRGLRTGRGQQSRILTSYGTSIVHDTNLSKTDRCKCDVCLKGSNSTFGCGWRLS